MELTPEQNHALEEILKFKKDIITLGGWAGTGKSTVVSQLHQKLPEFAVAAFTGKAANVLRKKGISIASTIHSLIYKPVCDPKTGKIMLDENGSPVFELNPALACKGIIVDEASMVSREIHDDLKSFGLPLVFVGDHGQLEPVGDSVNLMAKPDLTLEQIHRNAGEIAHFAEFIRKGYRPAAFAQKMPKKVFFIGKYDAENYFTKVDQIICAYNRTRVTVNQTVRDILGYDADWPVLNDRIMCLKNDHDKGLFNGMQGTITKMRGKRPKNQIEFCSNNMNFEVRFNPKQFNMEKYDGRDFSRGDPTPFDYAYCITAHKSQGDEWGNVMVLEQKCSNWDHKRWAYTAASRAKESLVWVEGY